MRDAVAELASARPEPEPRSYASFFPRLVKWAVPLAVAASLVLATRLAMTVQEMERLEKALEAERQRIEDIARSKSDLEERLSTTEAEVLQERESSAAALEELRTSMDQALAQRERRIDELARVFREEAQVLPHFELAGFDRVRSDRGLPKQLPMAQDARLFVIDLEVEDPEPYLRYRLEIAMKGSSDLIFETDEIQKQGRWLSLVLPSGFLADDTQYEIRLYGLEDGEAVKLKERYLVMIRR